MIKFEFSRSMSESQKQTEVVEILKHLKLQDSEAYKQFCDMVDFAQIIIDFEDKEKDDIQCRPTVNAIKVIRCKDCIYYDEDKLKCLSHVDDETEWYDNDFCSIACRR